MVVLRKPQAFGWFRSLFVAGLLTSLAVSSGCQTPEGTGAAAGGLLGFGLGGILSRCPGGALLGAAAGAGAGTLAGAAVDASQQKKAQQNAQAAAAAVAARAPSLNDIVNMTQNAVPTPQIIEQIRTCGVVYQLSADQIIWLNRQGVDPQVINALQDTALRPVRPVYTAPPVVVQQPVVGYVAPAPVVGVGYGWGR
jgi:uncharacterized membrane protein YebE (DUF533 family)